MYFLPLHFLFLKIFSFEFSLYFINYFEVAASIESYRSQVLRSGTASYFPRKTEEEYLPLNPGNSDFPCLLSVSPFCRLSFPLGARGPQKHLTSGGLSVSDEFELE